MSKFFDYSYNDKPVKELMPTNFWKGDKPLKCGKCNVSQCSTIVSQEINRRFDIDNPNKVYHTYMYYFECNRCGSENIINPDIFDKLMTDEEKDIICAISFDDVKKLTKRVFYEATIA